MGFLGFGSSNDNAPSITSTGTPTPAAADPRSQQIKNELITKVSQEIATANATALVNALTENCYKLCIFKPASSLSAEENKCIDDCSAKFMRSWNLISKSYITRINQG
ncbi:unnamed protein product [Ambrosiozyma monospora]|uniref:Mitochondrial import inner membrane translocase subunit n=1 Tax=Ambrosiozyma monospora TaxID=43982 RepID=A0A9W6YTL7_AMBMO|nr:unnamed protein product [Ambrosiozyma monospora]